MKHLEAIDSEDEQTQVQRGIVALHEAEYDFRSCIVLDEIVRDSTSGSYGFFCPVFIPQNPNGFDFMPVLPRPNI